MLTSRKLRSSWLQVRARSERPGRGCQVPPGLLADLVQLRGRGGAGGGANAGAARRAAGEVSAPPNHDVPQQQLSVSDVGLAGEQCAWCVLVEVAAGQCNVKLHHSIVLYKTPCHGTGFRAHWWSEDRDGGARRSGDGAARPPRRSKHQPGTLTFSVRAEVRAKRPRVLSIKDVV
jgi:hypothetical protein